VLMLQRTLEDIRDDLHVAMTVRAETLARRHAVLVNHAQRAKAHEPRVVIISKRKGVIGIEPTMIAMAPLVGFANVKHNGTRSLLCGSRRSRWFSRPLIMHDRARAPLSRGTCAAFPASLTVGTP